MRFAGYGEVCRGQLSGKGCVAGASSNRIGLEPSDPDDTAKKNIVATNEHN
jgi:hypothetical protein